ncbi:hypothetical protein FOIG_01035 [Fusarium odoratissimum NRRL 54006]|uniref:Uncharacterized protein n=2 Tax=Fusarium oxysporum species complex TaxID=171631 RepID=X0KCG7_FUSO5|nr:uncharacterized protein FOIG_01035 [Fusarium odoratissimum NRRL 54006]EXM11284.1 hypothetical protein FOIG_01035 [Fusarium odoratissimum NRRL 54006]TXC03982.1 hypothetical protein FocTR4_00001123 [Fusarium oxysporum f. sp. cubense]
MARGLSSAAQPGPARPASLREPTPSELGTYKPLIRLVFLCNNAQPVKNVAARLPSTLGEQILASFCRWPHTLSVHLSLSSHRHPFSSIASQFVGVRSVSSCYIVSPTTLLPAALPCPVS